MLDFDIKVIALVVKIVAINDVFRFLANCQSHPWDIYSQTFSLIIIMIIYKLIVQYPTQFIGSLRSVGNSCLVSLCAGEWWALKKLQCL